MIFFFVCLFVCLFLFCFPPSTSLLPFRLLGSVMCRVGCDSYAKSERGTTTMVHFISCYPCHAHKRNPFRHASFSFSFVFSSFFLCIYVLLLLFFCLFPFSPMASFRQHHHPLPGPQFSVTLHGDQNNCRRHSLFSSTEKSFCPPSETPLLLKPPPPPKK